MNWSMLMNQPMVNNNMMNNMMNNNMMNNNMMKMYFNDDYGSLYEVFLMFYQWRISSPGELAAACVGLFVLSALYEGLKIGRELLARKHNGANFVLKHNASVPMNDVGKSPSNSTATMVQDSKIRKRASPFNIGHVVQSFLHILQVTVSYMLMLVIMTFNVYMCLSIVLGAGAGYFAFAWKKSSSSSLQDNNEHCN